LQKCHRVPEAVHEYDVLLAQNPHQLEVQSHRLFALNYLHNQSPDSLFAAHKAYGDFVEKGAVTTALPNLPDPERKLRVMISSADFREHSVAYFMEPLLRFLDRDRFEIILYNFCTKPDAVTERFQRLANVWRDCPSQIENVLEPTIRADAPDIAVDLGGHTGNSLLPLFARRLAPVQISYLGYPNTTGLTAMDYRLVDGTSDPASDADRLNTETLVRFSSCAWVYSPASGAPSPAPAPCVNRGFVTFGSFNNFSKVTDEILVLWARLLNEVAGSRLLLKSIGLADPSIATNVRERLRRAGLPEERVELSGAKATTSEHLAAYSLIDVALDTAPYNGTTTTCEALWMGVPVVTLLGNSNAARVGGSLLQATSHAKWIATNAGDYLRIAKDLASDPDKLAALRNTLRSEMQHSTLMDHAGQSARFADALRSCWKKWCATQTGESARE
jgi:protein O-GlcNAc transferase